MARKSGMDGRSDVLDAAARLFYANGIEAVSVDQVARSAGLTKRAVYYHYPSKRDLVLAYLESADDPALTLLKALSQDRGASGRHPYVTILNGLERWIAKDTFHGCAFLNAARALPGDQAVAAIARAHKRRTLDWLGDVASACGHADAERTAGRFLLILDAVLATGHLYPTADLLDRARQALEPIIEGVRSHHPKTERQP